jgi:hypothetical protein
VQVTGGDAIGCMRRADSTVSCWGYASKGIMNIPPGLTGVTHVSARAEHACALKSDGTVVCWGFNPDGRATPPPGLQGVTQLSAGATHSCALLSNATVTCWGTNDWGETTIPAGLTNVIHVSAGRSATCALRSDHTVVCWGLDDFGQANVPAHLRPTPIPQAIQFSSTPPSPAFVGQNYTVAASGGGSGNAVTFSSQSPAVCSVAGPLVTFLSSGTCTVAADQAGSLLYAAAPQVTQSFAVVKIPQQVTFTSTLTNTFPTGSSALAATGGASGNAVVFSSLTPAVCTVTGTTVDYIAEGACTVAADQAGNATYEDAPQVTQAATIAKLAQVVTFTTPIPHAVLGGSYTPAATASSGLPVVITVVVGSACVQSTGFVSFASIGPCSLIAWQAGDAKYLPSGASQGFVIVYPFTGFFNPIANAPATNTAKAGSVITIRFSLGGNRGLGILSKAQSGQMPIACNAVTQVSLSTQEATTVKYDAVKGWYSYQWRTSTTWKNTCRQLVLQLNDGTYRGANFLFNK